MIKNILLSPFSWLYGAVIKTRHSLYEKNVFKSYGLGVKTISVGNITFGGTGKTPLVAFIAKILAEKGEKVCILTRGYGRDNPKERVLVSDGEKILADVKEAGDEPFELAKKLLGVSAIIADAKRAEAGKWMRENFGITVFVLDDGFQHIRVKRDLDIVLFDATNPFGNGKLLSAGILRESLKSLKRADALIITRANLVDNDEIEALKAYLLKTAPNCKIFVSQNKFTGLTKLKEFQKKISQNESLNINNHNYLAFCALGNPDNFFEQLRREKFQLKATKSFSDHYVYTQKDVRNLETEAIEKGAEVLLTTAKDAVKLTHLKFNFPCYIVENGLTFDDESAFVNLLLNSKS